MVISEKTEKWLTTWVPVISEALGALAIISAAVTYGLSEYKSGRAEISASIIASRSNGLSLLITNSGGVDLALSKAQFQISALNNTESIKLVESDLLIPKGTSRVIVSAPSVLHDAVVFDSFLDNAKETPQSACTIILQFVAADGSSVSPTRIPLSCIRASVKRE